MLTATQVKLCDALLNLGALKLSPQAPFTWASGARMPVYNDNRLLLSQPDYRSLVCRGFGEVIEKENLSFEIIAGCATAGIPHATTLADRLKKPLCYVRSSAKEHGLAKALEGAPPKGMRCLVVEDLVSTGGSALKAVLALREAGLQAEDILCIFDYGFPKASENAREQGCKIHSLLSMPELIDYLAETDCMDDESVALLKDWIADPFGWGKQLEN